MNRTWEVIKHSNNKNLPTKKLIYKLANIYLKMECHKKKLTNYLQKKDKPIEPN